MVVPGSCSSVVAKEAHTPVGVRRISLLEGRSQGLETDDGRGASWVSPRCCVSMVST